MPGKTDPHITYLCAAEESKRRATKETLHRLVEGADIEGWSEGRGMVEQGEEAGEGVVEELIICLRERGGVEEGEQGCEKRVSERRS